MARVLAILKALGVAFRRDQKSLQTIGGNNFFIVSAIVMEKAGGFIYLIAGLVLLFPASTDPLRKIPASRLALWPLERRERLLLRAISPWANPVSWIIAGLAVWAARGKVTFGLWGLVAGLFAAGFLLSDLPGVPTEALWRRIPALPGRTGQLIRKNLREMLSTLDFYCALILCLSSVGFRMAGLLPPEGPMVISILVVLALSSYAQSLFGLDGDGGLARYRLLPLSGFEILAAKDAAFLLIAIPLVLPLAPVAGSCAALVALAMGHSPTVDQPREQTRWRFSMGASLVFGLVQAVMMASAAAASVFQSWLVIVPCVGIWAGSLWWYGRRLDERSAEI